MATLKQQKQNKQDQGFRVVTHCYVCKHFDFIYSNKCKLGGFKVELYNTATCDKADSKF